MGNSLRIEGCVHSHWFPVPRRMYANIITVVSVPVTFTYRNGLYVLLSAIAIGLCFTLHCVAPKRLVIWTLKTRLLEERLCTVWVLCIIINNYQRANCVAPNRLAIRTLETWYLKEKLCTVSLSQQWIYASVHYIQFLLISFPRRPKSGNHSLQDNVLSLRQLRQAYVTPKRLVSRTFRNTVNGTEVVHCLKQTLMSIRRYKVRVSSQGLISHR